MAGLNFDASQVAPSTGYEVVPAGWYEVMIDESTMKPTKDGSGQYLEVRFNILNGQYAQRKVFTRFNLLNQNPTAQQIGHSQLSALCHAIGVLQVQDSQQLHAIPLKVKVSLRKDSSGQYEDSNEVRGYKNINEVVEGNPMASTGFQPAQAWATQPMPQNNPVYGSPVQPMQQPMQQPQAPAYAPQPQFAQPQYAAQQPQPVQQPWNQAPQQAPQQAPAWTQPAQTQAPQQQVPQQQATQQQAWSQPAGQQPWNQPQATQPPATQPPLQNQSWTQSVTQNNAQSATPPWMPQ